MPLSNCSTMTFWGAATYGAPRPDIGGQYGSQFTNSGFSLVLSNKLAAEYYVETWVHSTVTGNWYLNVITFTAQATQSNPVMAIYTPANNQGVAQPFSVSGYGIDRGATSGTGVDQVSNWYYPNPGSGQAPVGLGPTTYGSSRPDVAATYGSQFLNSGHQKTISTLSAGTYWLRFRATARLQAHGRRSLSPCTSISRPILSPSTAGERAPAPARSP